MTKTQRRQISKYPLEASLITVAFFLFMIFFFYLREEHETHITYVEEARKAKVDRVTAEYDHLLALLKNFVYYNGEEIVRDVSNGRSFASLNLTFFVRENEAIHNIFVFDNNFDMLRSLKKEDTDAKETGKRLRDLRFIEGFIFENTDQIYEGDGIHKVYFPVEREGYIVFVLNNIILKNAAGDSFFDITFYNENFLRLAGSNVRTPGEGTDPRLIQLLTGEDEGVYTFDGEELSLGHIFLNNGIILTTLHAVDINRSHLLYYTFAIILLIFPISYLLGRSLVYTVQSKIIGREILFEYDDPIIQKLDKSLRTNITNANRMLEAHLDIQVMKEDLIECREQLAHRRRREKGRKKG